MRSASENSALAKYQLDHPWAAQAPSDLLDHNAPCCLRAREWITCMDASFVTGLDKLRGPLWLLQKFKWGPSPWPLYWCQAATMETIDCGVLAVLARSAFAQRGLVCHAVQLVEWFPEQNLHNWRATWERKAASSGWIGDKGVYHEACAPEVDDRCIIIWDPTSGCWISPHQHSGYAESLAIKVNRSVDVEDKAVVWGDLQIQLGQWTLIPKA